MSEIDAEKKAESLNLLEQVEPPQNLDKAKKIYESCVNEWKKKPKHDEKNMEKIAMKFQEKCEKKGYVCKVVSGYIINFEGLVEEKTWNVIIMNKEEIPVDITWKSEEEKGFGNLENTHFEKKVKQNEILEVAKIITSIYHTNYQKVGLPFLKDKLKHYVIFQKISIFTIENSERDMIKSLEIDAIKEYLKRYYKVQV